MSLIKKLCLVGVALLLLLVGVFAWHKGLPPFDGQLNTAVEQAEANKSDPAAKHEADSASGESPQQHADPAADKSTESKASEDTEAKGTEAKTTDEASADKPAAEADSAASPATDEEGAAPGEAVVRGTVEKGDTVINACRGRQSGSAGIHKCDPRVFSMRAFRDGQPYVVVVADAATGKVKRFEYEIDSRRRFGG